MSKISSNRMARINLFGLVYKDYHIGYFEDWPGNRHQITAAWGKNGEWTEAHILVDTPEEALKLAKDCIDYDLRKEEMEKKLGRELTLEEMRSV